MEFSAYLENIPLLHSWDEGKTWNDGGFSKESFVNQHGFFEKHGAPRRILETGAGNSTIFFLLHKPEKLVSIAPDAALFERITSFCDKNEIDRNGLECLAAGSQWALPDLAKSQARFDFALIDGFHGWPVVMVDFYYINAIVEPGGYIMIDDTQLYSIKELCRWLNEQPGFELVHIHGKSSIFKKLWPGDVTEFGGQPYILRKTEEEGTESFRV
jgi:hypothetical protein